VDWSAFAVVGVVGVVARATVPTVTCRVSRTNFRNVIQCHDVTGDGELLTIFDYDHFLPFT
jgi:hypothetical protein